MSDKCFLDTNILIYCYSNTELLKKQQAIEITDNAEAFISTQVLKEFANVMNRRYKISWADVRVAVGKLENKFGIFINTATTIQKACSIAERYQYSFYDSLIISSAIESNCSILYSEDMQHGQMIEGRLKIVNPFVT